jgi:hypothetical protein
MSSDLQVLDWRGTQYRLSVDSDPDVCPICHRAIQPVDQRSDFLISDGHRVLQRVFRCPKRECQHLFVGRYTQRLNNSTYFLDVCLPAEPQDYVFHPSIRKISEDFCAIYNEAQKAEQLQLTLVCGPGYRKALEFLIKDYVSKLHPTPEDKLRIEKMPLMACIT